MTEKTKKEIYEQIERLYDKAEITSADITPRAILLLCQIFMEYIEMEMRQHGEA